MAVPFVVDGGWRFRPLERSDFALLSRWLSTPHVARWWAHETTDAALERDFGECIDGTEPCEVFIAQWSPLSHDSSPVGLIQRFRWDSYPDYIDEVAPIMPIPAGAFSIDYFIGEPDAVGRGLGSSMIDAFVAATFRQWADPANPAMEAIVPVHADNVASSRALTKAGFEIAANGDLEPDNPIDDWRHVIARRRSTA